MPPRPFCRTRPLPLCRGPDLYSRPSTGSTGSEMAVVTFTSNLERHVECPTRQVAAASVGEALAEVFAENPRLRGYILDDQGRLRKHVLILVDGVLVRDRDRLTDPVTDSATICVAQALSGG